VLVSLYVTPDCVCVCVKEIRPSAEVSNGEVMCGLVPVKSCRTEQFE
jgi:hypothetical protein